MSQSLVNQFVHVMWSTKDPQIILDPSIKQELHKYLIWFMKTDHVRVFEIGGANDHVHILLKLPPMIALSKLIGTIKSYSTKWLKNVKEQDLQFSWQDGYAAFSVDPEKLGAVQSYISSDSNRHASKKYKTELTDLLRLQRIPFKDEYILTTTHTKLSLHLIWSTKNRYGFLEKVIRQDLFHYLIEITEKQRGKLIEVGGIEDHVHLLVDAPCHIALSDFIQHLKTRSSLWLKKHFASCQSFEWQNGYGGYTVSNNRVDGLRQYIRTQEEHHQKISPQEEWKQFLVSMGYKEPLRG